jgi:anti-sigma factor RsiW
MANKISCREVRRRIETQPKGECEETADLIAEHLRGCEACAALNASWQRIEQNLTESKRWLDELASNTVLSSRPVLVEARKPARGRIPLLIPLGAGAVAALVLIVLGALSLFRPKEDTSPRRVEAPRIAIPTVSRQSAARASSQTLHQLVEVAYRYEAAPFTPPMPPQAIPATIDVPRLLQSSRSESQRILRIMAQSQTRFAAEYKEL